MWGQWRELLHLTYLSMNFRWNSERTCVVEVLLLSRDITMKDSTNISISLRVTEVCYTKIDKIFISNWWTLLSFAWTSVSLWLYAVILHLIGYYSSSPLVISWQDLFTYSVTPLSTVTGYQHIQEILQLWPVVQDLFPLFHTVSDEHTKAKE